LRWAVGLLKQKQYAKAKKKFKRAIQISPDRYHLYNEWLNALYSAREFEEVIFLVEKYLDRFSNKCIAQNTMGVCFLHLGDYENAIKTFEKVTLMKDDYYLAYYNWALGLYLQGKQREALEMYEKAKQIHLFPDGIYQREVANLKEDLKREENKMLVESLRMEIKAFEYFVAIDRQKGQKRGSGERSIEV